MRTREAYVHIHLGGVFVPAGRLSVWEDGRRSTCTFRYGNNYLLRPDALALDPVSLPLQKGRVFDGPTGGELFGGIRDALPDAWGRHVLDRAAEYSTPPLTEFDYMLYAGPDRIGALGFSTKVQEAPFTAVPPWARNIPGLELDFTGLLQAADALEAEESLAPEYRRFFIRGSSLGGARPKAAVTLDNRQWLAKFDKVGEAWPTCNIEHATMTLARLCGITVAETRLVPVFSQREILLVARFDRQQSPAGIQRIPFISALTLLGKSQEQAEAKASYAQIALALRQHCRHDYISSNLRELYTRMIFNIVCNNYDDHLRNHGFIYDASGKGGWRLSPAYDLVVQPTTGEATRTLYLGVGPQGRLATTQNALAACESFALQREDAGQIITSIQHIVKSQWEGVFQEAGLSALQRAQVRESLLF